MNDTARGKMAERRTLGKALDISLENVSFIQNGTAGENPRPGIAQNSDRRNALDSATKPSSMGGPAASDQASFPGLSRILVPLTTRLNPTTLQALRRACLEQRLQYRTPDSVQQIVEEAIRDWLRDRGFLE